MAVHKLLALSSSLMALYPGWRAIQCPHALLQDRCQKWADDGECATNAGWMNTNCRKSCNSCTNVQSFTQVDCDCCTDNLACHCLHMAHWPAELRLCSLTEHSQFVTKEWVYGVQGMRHVVVQMQAADWIPCRLSWAAPLACSSLLLRAQLSCC